MIGYGDGTDDCLRLVNQVGPPSLEVDPCTLVVDNFAAVRVSRPSDWFVIHAAVRIEVPPSARVNRSANSLAGRACK